MQVELSVDELETIIDWWNVYKQESIPSTDDDKLSERLNEIWAESRELESMDFDDCAGGACTL